MDKEKAIEKLQCQIDYIAEIKKDPRFSPAFKKWHRDTEIAIQNIFGDNTRHIEDFRSSFVFDNLSLAASIKKYSEQQYQEAFRNGLESQRNILQSLIEEVQGYWTKVDVASQPNGINRIEQICERFHLIAQQLRSRHDGRETLKVEDEYDVQDLLYCLLLLEFDDIRREESTPSYAGSSARMDFLLKEAGIVIEVKKTRKGLGKKEIVDQLLVDIGRYQVHPDCSSLICFVYDPEGHVANPRGVETDLTKRFDNVDVRVFIKPKGL